MVQGDPMNGEHGKIYKEITDLKIAVGDIKKDTEYTRGSIDKFDGRITKVEDFSSKMKGGLKLASVGAVIIISTVAIYANYLSSV